MLTELGNTILPPSIEEIRRVAAEKSELNKSVMIDNQIQEISDRIKQVSATGRWVLYEVRMLPEVIVIFQQAGYTIGDYNDVSKTYTIRWDE